MSKVKDYIANAYDGLLKIGAAGYQLYLAQKLKGRPIGILWKNYDFMYHSLRRNIGDTNFDYDGYGSPIGSIARKDLNMNSRLPWFMVDWNKSKTSNYIEYFNKSYDGRGSISVNFAPDDVKREFFTVDSLYTENNKVGAVRGFDIMPINAYKSLDMINSVNPNGKFDTRTGLINNFYLNATLNNARNERANKSNGITKGVYDKFGFDGENGIKCPYSTLINDRVRTQDEFMGDIIPWSTVDHTYNSTIIGGGGDGNLSLVKDILKLDNKDGLSIDFTDQPQNRTITNEYDPFGNFYSLTYSLGLIHSTDEKTKKFIAKSMFGYDLLGDKGEDNFDFTNGDIPTHPNKKYFVSTGSRGSNYIDAITAIDVEFVKYNNKTVRSVLRDAGNDNLWACNVLYEYGEAEGNKKGTPSDELKTGSTYNLGTTFGKHVVYTDITTENKKDVINYTNKLFLNGHMETLISRFHTDEIPDGKVGARANRDMTSSAISKYGMSHGRNLLKVKPTIEHGYSNPYCRVWTYHHQYATLNETIRPFKKSGDTLENTELTKYRVEGGITKLEEYGVKGKNGLLRIAPSKEEQNIKKCMFSIENLAWKGEKDFFKGHEEQKGPYGGRIMWFPPYDLKFSENVGVNWGENQFIGRGEAIYTYANTDRGGNLSFKLLIDHPSIVNAWSGPVNGGDNVGDVDDIDSNEQQLLRFFAGCDMLIGKKLEKKEAKPKKVVPEVKVEPVVTPKTVFDEINFFVFYPNNFSGIDFLPSSKISPMEYLANGIGANRFREKESDKINLLATNNKNHYNGYEMTDVGISVIGDNKSIGGRVKGAVTELEYEENGEVALMHTQDAKNKVGGKSHWGYMVDSRVENEVLHPWKNDLKINDYDYNYRDVKSFKLNSTGYESLVSVHTDASKLLENFTLYSFADVFVALQPEYEETLKGLYDDGRVEEIRALLTDFDVESVEVTGYASSHGYKVSNDKLSSNRARSVINWLNSINKKKFGKHLLKYNGQKVGNVGKNYDTWSFLAKAWRSTKVTIKLRKEEVISVDRDNIKIGEEPMLSNINYYDNQIQNSIDNAVKLTEEYDIRTMEELKGRFKDFSKVQILSSVNQVENNSANADARMLDALSNGKPFNLNDIDSNGYGDEYKFFTDLEENEPFLHSKLVEKIKYFDPAFHSITPEGFQSRLTFLHQCTRQGNTNGGSDSEGKNKNVYNLSFGKPPICVLRIGDFYNTKIIIKSLNISYDDTTWDLNDEGIGVMPMMANITIDFKFLGGSDLTGPISRLQNALSFNHYANTSVYDDRAEEPIFDNDGNIIGIKKFNK